jgi:general stress protein 26
MSQHAEKIERTWDLIEKIGICFFVTNGAAGMRGRPLASIPKRDEGRIYFLIDRNQGSKDEELSKNSQSYLAFGDGSAKFVSVNGTATVSNDLSLVKALWNPGAQAFWPDGPSSPGIAAIIFTPTSAEYWDGPSTIVSTAKFVFALATGSSADMGDNEKVAGL